MAPSFLILIMMAYGMSTGNTWFQYGGIVLVLGAQIAWQVYKSVKSGPAMDSNMKEAARARRSKALHYVSDKDVRAAQMAGGSSGAMSQAAGMMGMLLVPLMVFFGINYLMGIVWPDTLPWQRYVTGFLLSMPVSAVFMARSGMQGGGTPPVTPSSYVVTERGIVFDQMGRSLMVKFPLTKVERAKKNTNCVEVEGIKEADMIPNKLKLYTDKADDLLRILNQRVRKDLAR